MSVVVLARRVLKFSAVKELSEALASSQTGAG